MLTTNSKQIQFNNLKPIRKILIANRGEIALRIARTAKKMGIQTVTLYTEEEKGLPHCHAGDESYNLGSGALKETYLNQEKILHLAKTSGADAIHPGYGFLSEKSSFAQLVQESGITFIGPSSESIELMGDKKSSKIKIQELGVPSIPGYHGDNQDPTHLLEQAKKIGFPVLIKASGGGGGKGMRIANHEGEFFDHLASAKREAMNAFLNDVVLLEKYITQPRHIEVQVMCDLHGNHFHLFERECSIQRRYQKIIEESPSTAISPEIRQSITDAALKITRGIDYLGAGTVEFILDTDNRFYFLEMNTRLQVEHPVTEMVTGLDLVELQIQVAQGLPLNIHDLKQKGHSIEVRIYSEDPDNQFLPSIGKIKRIGLEKKEAHPDENSQSIEHPRLDCGYLDGNDVTTSFDPMLAKLIVWAPTRTQAIEKMLNALDVYLFLGVKTNRTYLKRILSHPAFAEGQTFTNFIQIYQDDLKPKQKTTTHKALAIVAALTHQQNGVSLHKSSTCGPHFFQPDVWQTLTRFRNV